MPELPEVETIRRMLKPDIINQKIIAVQAKLARMLQGVSARNLSRELSGQEIKNVIRRGKYLILELSRDSVMFHLGMTGQLVYSATETAKSSGYKRTITGLEVSVGSNPPDKHTHFIFSLSEGGSLNFRDIRTFGKVIFISGDDWKNHPRIKKLGPEPMELKPAAFLMTTLPVKSQRPVKTLLLDQSFICGIGNIYCDEALFLSGIHPEQHSDEMSNEQWKALINSVKKVLRKGIKNSGTTFSDYRKPDGSPGSNQESLKVYGRGGLSCKTCGESLLKISVVQRGTVFCPRCQQLGRLR